MVEEAEFEEAANQGSDISTPEDIPVYTDLAMTQVQCILSLGSPGERGDNESNNIYCQQSH